MQNRKLVSALCAAALSVGLAFGIAHADQSTKPPAKAKAKAGEVCKVDADCDQSMTCKASKCQAGPVVKDYPPPVT